MLSLNVYHVFLLVQSMKATYSLLGWVSVLFDTGKHSTVSAFVLTDRLLPRTITGLNHGVPPRNQCSLTVDTWDCATSKPLIHASFGGLFAK